MPRVSAVIPNGFKVETLLNLKAMKSVLKIVEVPSFEASRILGMSNLRAILDGWRVLKTIIRERFAYQPQPAVGQG